MPKLVVDISFWDGAISIPKLKASGVDAVIVKCGGGDAGLYTDPKWEQNYTNCKKAGINTGAYYYSAATTVDQAIKEAEYCLGLLKGKQLEYPVYMDVEEKTQQALGQATLRKVIQAWLDTIGKSWMRGVYTWAWLMPTGMDCETWFCAWTKSKPADCGMWQFGGETNAIRPTGVAGYDPIDQSYAYRDYPTIIKAAGLNGFGKKKGDTVTAYVSNCASDEHGGAYGGAAGDQTGREYRVRPWYDFGQTAVYRHPDPKVRSLMAQLATEAAENNHIGYDRGQRLTFRNQLRKVGYHPSKITTNCESDCSASTGAIIEGVGALLGDKKLYDYDTTLSTHNMDAALIAAGFRKLTDSKYTRSGDYLLAGDVCLNPGSHVNIVVTNGPKAGGSTVSYTIVPISVTVKLLQKSPIVRDAPSTKGKIVARYKTGDTVRLSGIVLNGDGHVWGAYKGGTSGLDRFIAIEQAKSV